MVIEPLFFLCSLISFCEPEYVLG